MMLLFKPFWAEGMPPDPVAGACLCHATRLWRTLGSLFVIASNICVPFGISIFTGTSLRVSSNKKNEVFLSLQDACLS